MNCWLPWLVLAGFAAIAVIGVINVFATDDDMYLDDPYRGL